MRDLKGNGKNELTYRTETASQTQRPNLEFASEGEWGKETGSLDGHVHTAAFKTDNQQGPTARHRGLCSVSRGWGFGGG